MRTAIPASHISVSPGVPVLFDIEVTNISDVIDGITATLTGLDPSWVQLVVPVVSLFPEGTATLTLRLEIPKDCLAGDYLVTAHVRSVIEPERRSDHEFWVSVQPLHAASMRMHPSVIIGKRSARFEAMVRNEGNVPTDFSMSVLDPERAAKCSVVPASLIVPAGESRSALVDVSGRRPWFSQAVSRELKIDAKSTTIELTQPATFTQRPRIARGVLTALVLAAIVAIWALVFLVVVDALRKTEDPAKAVPADFATGGPAEVDMAVVGGKISGEVKSADGKPLPRITVEAFRLGRGRVPVSVGSVATGDDGAYAFEALLPGPYHLRFTAEGFEEVWYPTAPDESGAADQNLTAGGEIPKLAVTMIGLPGTLSGEIVTPESTSPASTTITFTQVLEDPPEGTELPKPQGPFPVANGVFQLPELATPANYHIVVQSVGFEQAEFDETLGAGQKKVINTVTLSAARGTITGTVTDAFGNPVGNVDVTISSGPFSVTTKTPTAGNVGTFLVDKLETPQTYVVTFSLDGYDGETLTVDLGPGQNKVANGQVLGGTGTLRGLVTDAALTPIGGAKVLITGGSFTTETATLTGGDNATTGSWSVAGLPTPGVYTVTVSSAGFVDQTLLVVLGAGRSLDGIDTSLVRSTATIAGTVTTPATAASPAGGVGDVTVTLSNGGLPRITTTATAPAGAYLFADIPPGSYSITFSKTGFATRIVQITVAAGEPAIRNVDIPAIG